MISRALSAGFEWLYPFRLILAAAVLWRFRRKYAEMDWRFGGHAFALGGIAFLMWLALTRVAAGPSYAGMAGELRALPNFVGAAWLFCRIAASVVTVPIAEELAFRGFLLRYLISRDFERVRPQAFTWLSVLISCLAFGVLHGSQWLVGTIAGALYTGAYLRRGRIGDSVLAHATTNALLAGWILWSGDWSLW